VESLPLGANVYRVFLAAGSKVIVFTYDGNARSLAYARTMDGGCGDTFEQPFGLAVDPGNRTLYVVDGGGNDRLYRFSAIDSSSPACEGSVDRWGDLSFDDPGGVAAKGGPPTSEENRIVVADTDNSRIVAFFWDGLRLQETDLPEDFSPPPGKKPFDVAFDAEGKLWASYPFE
jgi:DNA-binding beta-propeller fold protein YncE